MTFDPSLLPDPALLGSLRDSQPSRPTPTADWYTPMLLFGQIGTPLQPGAIVGRIPIMAPCAPIGWSISADQPAALALGLQYAPPPDFSHAVAQTSADLLVDAEDDPVWQDITNNLPTLNSTTRRVYEQTPWLDGWPQTLNRYGEIQVTIAINGNGLGGAIAEQGLLVLYMRKIRVR